MDSPETKIEIEITLGRRRHCYENNKKKRQLTRNPRFSGTTHRIDKTRKDAPPLQQKTGKTNPSTQKTGLRRTQGSKTNRPTPETERRTTHNTHRRWRSQKHRRPNTPRTTRTRYIGKTTHGNKQRNRVNGLLHP